MKKRMMMLLTTVALVMGLTACGDSTASTGNDAASNSTPSLVVEGTSEPTPEATPEVTPEPTAEPAPQYTEVTIRDIQLLTKSVNGTEMWLPLIDGELPDASLTMAEMYFHIPEGMSITYEDILENADILYGIFGNKLPSASDWSETVSNISNSAIDCMADMGKSDFARNDDWTGDFHKGVSREVWEAIFTLHREEREESGQKYWANSATMNATEEAMGEVVVDLFNNNTVTEAFDFASKYEERYWETLTVEDIDKVFLYEVFLVNEIVVYRAGDEAAFEAYKADPTGWVDTYAEFKQQ